ncbi:MAG: hypothetical protein J6R27_02120 [Muribaculaceae bacterium]|nr:hypothetical protein [Muribaculaceae bacterium]
MFRIFAIALISGAMMAPQMEAQGRGNSGGGRQQSSVSASRSNQSSKSGGFRGNSGNSNKPSATTVQSNRNSNKPSGNVGNQGSRPNNKPNGNVGNQGSRPNNKPNGNVGNQGSRPNNKPNGNVGNQGSRPNNKPNGNVGNQGSRPNNKPNGNVGNYGNRPNNKPNGRPDKEFYPHKRPGIPAPGVRPRHDVRPPVWRPVPRPWVRPVPPRYWRPGIVVPKFSTILGLSFGIAINRSLDMLLNGGYRVYSYGNNVIYLNDVSQLNMLWPDAQLYYHNGGLQRGEFIYYTPYYDTYRYNSVYSRLVALYGDPVITNYPSNGMQTQWFGYDGRFVTLTYQPMYGEDGRMRYYTTLSFGF